MNIGDNVRLIALPEDLPAGDEPDALNTADLFRRCLGRIFPVVGFNELGYAELHVGEMDGQPAYMSSIWVEQRYLSLVASES